MIKKSITLIITFLLLVHVTSSQTKPVSGDFDLVIKNVNLIDGMGTEIKKNKDLFIKDGKIKNITDAKQVTYTNEIDASGKYLMPGLIDAHTHPSPTGFVRYGPENFPETFAQFVHFGVTTILVPGCSRCSYENMAVMKKLGDDHLIPAPRVIHTSPHFTMKGSHPVKTFQTPEWVNGSSIYFINNTRQIDSLVDLAAKNHSVGIKVTLEDGPTRPWVPRMPQELVNAIAARAEKNRLQVFAHVSDIHEVRMANKAGIKNLLHFVGVDIDWQNDQGLIDSLRLKKINWVTTLMIYKSFLYPFHPEWLNRKAITDVFDEEELATLRNSDAMMRRSKAFVSDETISIEQFLKPMLEDLKILHDQKFNLVIGTDQGNPFVFPGLSMHEEMEMMSLTGIKPLEIIRMATHNAAVMLGVSDHIGTIQIGKYADMILLEKNPAENIQNTLSIWAIFKHGVKQKRITE
ncbi:MAG TPA: amidohydrolase family protein [Ohtaekwangia sp.]|nr:amidohydrolase family protein [Ohtaekwangia sp.]